MTRIDWLSANVGIYDGSIVNFSAGADFRLLQNLGIAVKYNLFELDVGVDKSDWRGRVNASYEGLYAAISLYW